MKKGATHHVEIIADPRILAEFDAMEKNWRRPGGSYHIQLGHSATSFESDTSVDLPAATFSARRSHASP